MNVRAAGTDQNGPTKPAPHSSLFFTSFIMKKTALIIAALSVLTLSGCGHISKNFVSEDTPIEKAEFATGIEASRLSVVKGSVKPELDSIHYQVKTKGGATYRCYFTSAIAITSDAVCKKIGSKGKDPVKKNRQKNAEGCNALLKAAGRC